MDTPFTAGEAAFGPRPMFGAAGGFGPQDLFRLAAMMAPLGALGPLAGLAPRASAAALADPAEAMFASQAGRISPLLAGGIAGGTAGAYTLWDLFFNQKETPEEYSARTGRTFNHR
jgi:hypothetical protein